MVDCLHCCDMGYSILKQLPGRSWVFFVSTYEIVMATKMSTGSHYGSALAWRRFGTSLVLVRRVG